MAAREPEDVDRLFGERVNAGDVDGVVALYEPGAVLLGPAGEPAEGRDAIRAAVTQFVQAGLQLQMEVVKVVRCGDVAVLYNDWSGSRKGAGGAEVRIAGKAIEVVRRQADGSWLFAVDDPNART